MSHHLSAPAPAETWENEGGGLGLSTYAQAMGVTRMLTESYVVGGRAYTNLADAVAQGRRLHCRSTPS